MYHFILLRVLARAPLHSECQRISGLPPIGILYYLDKSFILTRCQPSFQRCLSLKLPVVPFFYTDFTQPLCAFPVISHVTWHPIYYPIPSAFFQLKTRIGVYASILCSAFSLHGNCFSFPHVKWSQILIFFEHFCIRVATCTILIVRHTPIWTYWYLYFFLLLPIFLKNFLYA